MRRGAEAFWTEITLSSGGQGRDYTVRRSVTLRRPDRDAPQDKAVTRYESKWAVNGGGSGGGGKGARAQRCECMHTCGGGVCDGGGEGGAM